MPRIRSCIAIVKGATKCKHRASSSSMCKQHIKSLANMPECPCCLEIVQKETKDHVQLECGHAIHFDCAHKWVLSGQKLGSSSTVTTCPTCRAPFSAVMMALLDDQLFMRMTISKMGVIVAGGVAWRLETIGMMSDLYKTIEHILKHCSEQIKRIQVPNNMHFTFKTLSEGRVWKMPNDINIYEVLVSFIDEIKKRIEKYKYCLEKSHVHQKMARRVLGNGKALEIVH